jgi:predicted phage-related endonuclease
MIVIDIPQNSDLWFAEKLGKPSASNASKIVTNTGEPSKQRTAYMYELAAERITGKREETYKNPIMEMGNEREDESRKLYEIMKGVTVSRVGVIYKDEAKKFLCSPDGIVNGEYGLELKNVLGKTQVGRLLDGNLPSEYFSQIQFSLYVTGFKFWDFMSYTPSMKPLLIRCASDIEFQTKLQAELEKFCSQLEDLVNQIK